MHYDFIEIGTSNYNTEAENSFGEWGISVEPIKHYLDCLPSNNKLVKVNCAISSNNIEEIVKIYYIPEETIDYYKLPQWLKGSNSINNYHVLHIENNLMDLVKVIDIQAIPIANLFNNNNVDSLRLLKIDTEGCDSDILIHYSEYLKTKDIGNYPETIIFEPLHCSISKTKKVIELYTEMGYNLVYLDNQNLHCELEFSKQTKKYT